MSNDEEFFKELRREFLDEALYLVEQCEESYLRLDQPELRAAELSNIFRVAHSLKGSGAVVGFTDLASFAHCVEDCLDILRNRPDFVDAEIISLLLRSGDALKMRVIMLRSADPGVWDVAALSAEVKAVTARLSARAKSDGSTASTSSTQQASGLKSEVAKDQPPMGARTGSGSIKIDAERIESVLNLVGELVVINSQLNNRCSRYTADPQLATIISLMDKTIRELQNNTLSMRMTPLKSLFMKTQRLVRDLSLELGKKIEFRMLGEETEIDRSMVELLSDPLIHITRNSLDHGIENAEVRKSRNKPEVGLIQLSAQQVGGRVVIKILDDGGGMSREKILRKAIERNLISATQDTNHLTDDQVFQFIFLPGFSTAENVTAVSGRGVGMDVVKTNIEKLKGTIAIESKEGKSSCLTISIPLTTAITTGMIVQLGAQPYILPLDAITEIVKIDRSRLVDIYSGGRAINHRGKIYSMVNLHEIIHSGSQSESLEQMTPPMLILLEVGGRTFGLGVDRVVGQTQVVLKPLAENFKSVQCVSGAAILGNGQVGLILDPHGILKFVSEVPSHLREATA